ncbi:hypothetical protein V8E55_011805 [Tylopilus felleus]
MDKVEGQRPNQAYIPLPSSLGHSKCIQLGLQDLMDMESQLRIGQANDALKEIHLGVAEKAVLFQNDIRPVTGYAKKTRAWRRVHVAQHALENKLIGTLARYQVLWKEQLNVNTSATNPKARGLRYEVLPWHFNLDIETEQQSSAWMSEFIQVHWLRAKATKERWLEEEELLKFEFNCQETGSTGAACYGTWQHATYAQLGEQCRTSLESIVHSGESSTDSSPTATPVKH